MEGALRASGVGLEGVDQARKRRGWNRQSAAWAEAASVSVASLKLFWRRERLSREAFIHICAAVGVAWEQVAERSLPVADWGEAPELSFFCGRTQELQVLTDWVTADRCKILILLGMGGIGKTTLAVQLTDRLSTQFQFVIWRSLRNAPPATTLISGLLQSLGELTIEGDRVAQLLSYLRQYRCLLILDNAESILQAGDYAAGCETYRELICRIGAERHQSCLLLTSREQLPDLVCLEGEWVRSLRLSGLATEAGQQLLERGGAPTASIETCQVIVEHYAGNPLALKIAAAGIRDLLCGDTTEFVQGLQQGQFIFGDLHDLLARQFERSSLPEQEILYWLAIAREPLSLDQLKQDLGSAESQRSLTATLALLQRRSLLETSQAGLTLQPAVMEYVTQRLIAQVGREIESGELMLFRTHALIQATARDDIRTAQTRLILQPLIDQLLRRYDNSNGLKSVLIRYLQLLRGQPPLKTGYVAGNSLNLLMALQIDLTDLDVSELTIWQADLRGVTLHKTNFTRASFQRSRFTEPFSNVLSVVFSPDGQTLVKGDDRGWISVWHVASNQLLLSFRAHEHWVFALAFSPDGSRLASGGLDCQIKLWDLSTGYCLRTIEKHREGIATIAFSPDGRLLASGSSDQTIQLFDAETGEWQQTFNGHRGIVKAVLWVVPPHVPTSFTLISASLDGSLKLWDILSGACLNTLEAPTALHSLTLLRRENSVSVAAAGDDGQIYLWELETEILSTLTMADRSSAQQRIWSVVATPDAEWLITAGDDALIKLWHVPTQRCLKLLTGHSDRIWSLSLSADGTTLVSGSDDQTVRLWDLKTGQCLQTFQGYHNHTVPIGFRADQLFTFSADQQLRIWDLTQPGSIQPSIQHHCIQTLHFPAKAALHVALSPDQTLLAIGNTDYTIRLYHLETGTLWQTLTGHLAWVREVAFSTDGRLASASGDHTVKLWDLNTGDCIHTFVGHKSPVRSVAFHPQGKLLASGSWDCTVKLWDVDRGVCLKTFVGHTGYIRQVMFTPDGQFLVSCGQDHAIHLWPIAQQTATVLEGHMAAVEAIACSPNSEWLASASLDGTVKLWGLKQGSCLQTLQTIVEPNSKLLFNPAGNQLAIACENTTCLIWDMQSSTVSQRLQVPRPYEGMKIAHTTGLTEGQKSILKALGAQES